LKRYLLSPAADRDQDAIGAYLAEHASPSTARRYILRFRDAAQLLAERPAIGHLRTDLTNDAVRFWSISPYMIVYDPGTQPLQILRILHSARDIPAVLR
jgi:toxin ParE1/3/4